MCKKKNAYKEGKNTLFGLNICIYYVGDTVWGLKNKISNKTIKDDVSNFRIMVEAIPIHVWINKPKTDPFIIVHKPGSNKVLHKSVLIPSISQGIYRLSFVSPQIEAVCVVMTKFYTFKILFYHCDSKKQW